MSQPKDIVEAFANYYRELKKKKKTLTSLRKLRLFCGLINLDRLSTEEANMMTSPIKEEEIKQVSSKIINGQI